MKKIREGYKITEFGEIPEEWNIGSIDELTTFIKSGLSRNLKDENVGIPCIRSNNIVNGRINYNDLKYWFLKDDKGANIEDYILNDGDVLVNFINSMAQIGKTCIYRSNGRDAIYTTNIFRVNFNKDKILNEYFYYFSQTDRYKKEIELITKPAVNQASFTTVDFKKIKLAIPIIKEQERIVSILSTVDEQIDNVDALIEKNKELKKGLMQTLLTKGIGHTKFKKTEIGEIPEEWEVIKFDNIISFLTDYEANGSFSSIKENVNIFDEPNYAYFVRATDLEKKDYINSVKYVDKESYKFLSKTSLNGGELLIAKRGQIGKVYLMPNLDKKATLAPNLYLIKLDNEKANNKYVYYYFISSIGQKRLISNSASTTLGAIYKDDVKKIKMVLPSIKEQEKIVLILSEIDEKIDGYENRREKLEELKKGLMQQLLTGKIRVI